MSGYLWTDLAGFLYMNTNPKKGDIHVAEKSAIQRIKDLDTERASIFDQAKEEALEKARGAIAALNALGLNYTLTTGAGKQANTGLANEKRPIKAEVSQSANFRPPRRTTAEPHRRKT